MPSFLQSLVFSVLFPAAQHHKTGSAAQQRHAQDRHHGKGNGRLDAVSNALQRHSDMHYSIVTYQEHALNVGSNSQACAYVGVQEPNGNVTWGSGIHEDIITASVLALISAVNRLDQ